MKLLLLFCLIISSTVFSQTYSLQGQIADSKTKEFLTSANVLLYDLSNNKQTGTTSARRGRFIFTGLKPAKYKIEISFIGYKSFTKELEITARSIDLEIIYLEQTSLQTGEIQVIDKLIPAVQKQDTTEFNTNAYKTNKDATAEELVNKIPGVTNQDGKIQVQGEEVKNVLVDGRIFFGNDPSAVLRNLPAEIVEKIQVFDKQSEQAEFTGFDDGNTSKTLNVITRLRVKEGTFGRATAGYGSEEKYMSGANLNFFKGDRRITILGQLNNVNEQNFSSEDLLGVMAESGGGMRGGFRRSPGEGRGSRGSGGFDQGGGFFRGGGDPSGFLVNNRDGITKTGAFGLNYADKWGEILDITGSYFYNSADNNVISSLKRDYFISSGIDQLYSENNLSNSGNENHRANLRIDYKLDSLNSFLFSPRISVQENVGNTNNKGNTVSGEDILNRIANIYNSDLSSIDVSGILLYRRRFETRGRTFSINLNSSYKKNKGENTLYSESIYHDEPLHSDTLDQLFRMDKDGRSTSANLIYTEPLGESSQLMITGSLSYNTEFSDQRTFYDEFNSGYYYLTDTSLSSIYNKTYKVLNFGSGYRYQNKDVMLVANVSLNSSNLVKEETFPSFILGSKHFYSVLPSLMLRYNFSRDKNLRFQYRAFNREPSIEQLQDVLNNSNPQQLSIGNPDLVQDYRHMLNLRYSSINTNTMSSFFALLSGTFAQDYMGYNTFIAGRDTLIYNDIIINPGVQLRVPQNLDGYLNLRSMLAYGLPVRLLKSNLNINVNLSYSKTPSVINSSTNEAKSSSAGIGFVLGSNFSNDLDFTIGSTCNYNVITNSVQKNNNSEYYSQRSRVKLFAIIWRGLFLQTEFNHQYNGGLSTVYDPNSYLLNLTVGKKLFANDQGEIRVTAFDILNKTSNITRNVTDTYWEDTSTNVIGSYFILSFTYNLRPF